MEAGAVEKELIEIESEEAAAVSKIINIIIYWIFVCITVWLCITTIVGRFVASFAVILSSFGGLIVSTNKHINGYMFAACDTNLPNNFCLLNGLFGIYFIMVHGFVAAITIEYLSSIAASISCLYGYKIVSAISTVTTDNNGSGGAGMQTSDTQKSNVLQSRPFVHIVHVNYIHL